MKQMPAVYLLLLILLLIKGSHCIISLAELNKDTLISLNISSCISLRLQLYVVKSRKVHETASSSSLTAI
jgi:hypothetical protein